MGNVCKTRNLAGWLGLGSDVERFEELIDLIVERFPETCGHPAPAGDSGAPAPAPI